MLYLPNKLVEIIIEYKSTQSPMAYHKLIESGRPVIFYTIFYLKKWLKYMRAYEDEELYDAAVIGLHKCAMSWLETTPPRYYLHMIIRAMVREIKVELRRQPYEHKVPSNVMDSTTVGRDSTAVSQFDTRDQFATMIQDGVITFEEFALLVDHVVHGMSMGSLAAREKCNRLTIKRRLHHVKDTLQCEWKERGWEYADFRS